ncbi:MAG: 5-(carboxyamino)imidazole ribonucleotide mutase [Candidatus Dormibacteria bacterium]
MSVIMGSESDREAVQRCADALANYGIEYEWDVISAHRDPDRLRDHVRSAPSRGVRVFVAAAGMAAHLPGVVASHTTLPVIGVPLAGGSLHGAEALLSVVQMPPGIPVATVAVGPAGAANAAHLAAQILALGDDELAGRVEQFREGMRRPPAAV